MITIFIVILAFIAFMGFTGTLLTGIILLHKDFNKYIESKNSANTVSADMLIRDTKYSEEDIVKHLDYIIEEALDEYILLNIRPKNIYYINDEMQAKIRDYLAEEIPGRISVTLWRHLSFIYDNSFLPTYLGKHIFMTVTYYTLNYNASNADEIPPNNVDIGTQMVADVN